MPGHFPSAWLDELNERADIVQIVSAYVPLKKNGSRYWGLCPFHHEKTPSFSVNAEQNLYYCFGCKAGGNVIHFIQEMEHLTFAEAVVYIADQLHFPVPEAQEDPLYESRRNQRERLLPVTKISDGGPFTRYTNNVNEAPTCWIAKNLRYRHNDQTIIQGLSNSCNYFFYELASRLYGDTGSNLLYQYAVNMGLTSKTGIELKGEARSLVGNQANLYDPSVSLGEQRTWTPTLVAAKIKQHLQSIGASNNISYDEERLDKCIKRMMDMKP